MTSAGVIQSKCPPWLWSKIAQCSVDAIKVLAALDAREAYSPARAITDKKLAALTGLPERDIIDLTGALIDAGLPIVALTVPPFGRYIVLPGDKDGRLAARKHEKDLHHRAGKIHVRANGLGKGLDDYDHHDRPADSTGQLALGLPADDTPRWRDN